jgi:hypothetical protein
MFDGQLKRCFLICKTHVTEEDLEEGIIEVIKY